MTNSPFRRPLTERSSHATTSTTTIAVQDFRQPSPPLGYNLSWKKPRISSAKEHSLLQDEKDRDASTGESSDLQTLPPISWRIPMIANVSEPTLQQDETVDSLVMEPEAPSGPSLKINLDDEEGTYELESVLLEEEEYSIPEYCRHRKLTGLDSLDGRFGLERHSYIKEEEEQKGLVCGSILEVAGTPGSGKTTLMIQMAVRERISGILKARERSKGKQKEDVRINDWLKTGEGAQQVLLIDTEGGIGLDRIVCIAKHQIEHLDPALSLNGSDLLRSVLAGIRYCRCTSEVELLSLFQTLLPITKRSLTTSMQAESKTKMQYTPRLAMRTTMIIIDTISYHMRAALPDEARHLRNQRNLLIYELKQFAERCKRRGINLVLANQMGFTMVNKDGATTSLADKDGEGRLVPLLRSQSESILGSNEWRLLLFRAGSHHGEACNRFAHFMGQPVLLNQQGNPQVFSSSWLPYIVDQGGMVDLTAPIN